MLKALENDDEPSAKDEIRLFVRGAGAALPSCDPLGSPVSFSQSLNEIRRLTNNGFENATFGIVTLPLDMKLCEEDVPIDTNDFYSPIVSIAPLGDAEPNDSGPIDADICENHPGCEDADWHYRLKYQRRHERMEVEDAGGDPVAPVCP